MSEHMNEVDLRNCMENWPYDAEKNVRMGRGEDGREIILVRQPMGLEQYEVDGRPDGRRVHGLDSALDFHQTRINVAQQTSPTMVVELTAADCAELFHEADVFLHRLNLFFRLKNWTRAERDAAQILHLFEFVKQHARRAEDCVQLHRWHPHTMRIHGVARAMPLLDNGHDQEAFQMARETNYRGRGQSMII